MTVSLEQELIVVVVVLAFSSLFVAAVAELAAEPISSC